MVYYWFINGLFVILLIYCFIGLLVYLFLMGILLRFVLVSKLIYGLLGTLKRAHDL